MNLKPTVVAVRWLPWRRSRHRRPLQGLSRIYAPRPAYTVVRVADSGYRGDVVYARVVDVALDRASRHGIDAAPRVLG